MCCFEKDKNRKNKEKPSLPQKRSITRVLPKKMRLHRLPLRLWELKQGWKRLLVRRCPGNPFPTRCPVPKSMSQGKWILHMSRRKRRCASILTVLKRVTISICYRIRKGKRLAGRRIFLRLPYGWTVTETHITIKSFYKSVPENSIIIPAHFFLPAFSSRKQLLWRIKPA